MVKFNTIIIGSGPAGLGAAFHLSKNLKNHKILILEKEKTSTGGLRNDCKMNFSYPIGFPEDYWTKVLAEKYLEICSSVLKPEIMNKTNLSIYHKRAEKLGVKLMEIKQSHLGTDGGLELINKLIKELEQRGVEIHLQEEMISLNEKRKIVITEKAEYSFENLFISSGRKNFRFMQKVLDELDVEYKDNVVDVGIRVEAREENYTIVKDYYDPKFHFPDNVRTFCTNSGSAYVVREKYISEHKRTYYSLNGHSFSGKRMNNGLVNFAMLYTVRFTAPMASGQDFAESLGLQASLMGGGKPVMQRVGDFRLGKRSKSESFSGDLYDFEPTLKSCTPGDISLSMPAKILRSIWSSMKKLDTIVPGILHPSTIMYYPEIKLYANRPVFLDDNFRIKENIFAIGDGAGTSRGITAAWSSGVRAADFIVSNN